MNIESSGIKAEVALLATSAMICSGVFVSIVDTVAVGMSGRIDKLDEKKNLSSLRSVYSAYNAPYNR